MWKVNSASKIHSKLKLMTKSIKPYFTIMFLKFKKRKEIIEVKCLLCELQDRLLLF